ncbi:MAG: T9SS type A sorting domain-containing protein [Bacteroidales bacterium]|nr:T9SS type A sorting domain-containing protein [Bacteroidales bacterium]
MKRFISIMMLALTISGMAFAQGSPCEITVTGSFDSECLYDYKTDFGDEAAGFMVACRNSMVTYTAHANTGTASVTGYTWEVYGDVAHSVSAAGDQVTVDWGGTGWGMLLATVETSAGDMCTKAVRVRLIDSPTAAAVTIPAYTVMPDGSKVIRVCKGGTVQFIDRSSGGGGDIAGCNWSCGYSQPSSLPVYTIDNVTSDDKVTHTVTNNCGCTDDEEYIIELVEGETLELECYGTVCEGAIVEYTATNPTCTDYMWYVDGGTLVDGQGTAAPVVQWDRPHDGYGILGLDGVVCDENEACPTLMSRKIPVISSGLTIDGDADLCVGDVARYTLPLFGSTEYSWSVTPTTGVNTSMMNPTNEILLEFSAAGTYTLSCDYRCDFIDCGPHHAAPLTITVKPAFDIAGDDRVCLGNNCTFASGAVAATWKAYNLASGNAVVATGTGTTFSPVFTSAGRYLITAESAAYCGPATHVVEVLPPPPAPTLVDLDPANRHAACPYGGITLSGTPAEPSYTFVWAPACTTATPQHYSGESVTVEYHGDVCNVLVYNYDRELHCMSATAYVHQVDVLLPETLNIPQPLTVCPGSLIHWDNGEVPDQRADGMLYEWTIDDDYKYCASVQGNHQLPSVTFAVSDITPQQTPFNVFLRRDYCNTFSRCTIAVQIVDFSANVLSIAGPDYVCRNSAGIFTATGVTNSGSFWWVADDNISTSNPASLDFHHDGAATVSLYDNPYTYCTRSDMLPTALKTVTVKPAPLVLGLDRVPGGQLFEVEVQPNSLTGCSYAWEYQATPGGAFASVTGGVRTAYLGPGVYRCTVTGQNGCSTTVTWDASVAAAMDGWQAGNVMTIDGEFNPCNRELTFSAPNNVPYVTWQVSHNGEWLTPQPSGNLNHTATLEVTEVGQYDALGVVSDIFGTSYIGRKTMYVEAIPNITFIPQCDSILFENKTLYVDSSTVLTIEVRIEGNDYSRTQIIQLAAGTPTYTFIPTGLNINQEYSFSFWITGIGTNSDITPCLLRTVTLHGPFDNNYTHVTISTINNDNVTCDNTPMKLIASLNTDGAIASTHWTFSDGSSIETANNSVFHTFEYNPMVTHYNVSASVIDNYGCHHSTSTIFPITAHESNFPVDYFVSNPILACPYSMPKHLSYSTYNSSYNYIWYNPDATLAEYTNNTCTTYYAGNYTVYVEDNYHCKHNAMQYVSFLEAPSASFYASKYNCCVGETVDLYGNHGATDAVLSFFWTIDEPPGGNTYNFYTPDISYTPQVNGNHTIKLEVTNATTGCTSTETTTLDVNNIPSAPTLSINGSPCIANAPVRLTATGYTGEMHWSNGATGAIADYFTPGIATGYYFDPSLGCASEEGTVRIERQPNLDALLTGCYLKCEDQIGGTLPVYSLASSGQTIWWEWDNGIVTNGYHTGNDQPLLLPLELGDHYLTVGSPGTSCQQTSSVLRIGEKVKCDCEGIEVTYTLSPRVNHCNLQYLATVSICNHNASKLCIDDLILLNYTNNVTITSETLTGNMVNSNDCETFYINMEVSEMPPSSLLLRIVDNECADCTKDFAIDLTPEVHCNGRMENIDWDIDYEMSSQVAGYINFITTVGSVENVIAFWSEPPMVVDWLFDGVSDVNGLGMIDMSLLSQLADAGGELCFHAIVCADDELCELTVCVDASILYETIVGNMNRKSTSGETSYARPARNHSTPQLVPNPALDEVTVVADGEITEVVVMDMHGHHLLTVRDMTTVDISRLASGMYIVRVRVKRGDDTPDSIDYLKLTKK